MSKSILIIDTPENCYECPCFMEEGWRCQCRMENDEEVHDGRPEWCPLKEYKEAIPVEWIREQAMKNWYRTNDSHWYIVAIRMIEEWMEKENEREID